MKKIQITSGGIIFWLTLYYKPDYLPDTSLGISVFHQNLSITYRSADYLSLSALDLDVTQQQPSAVYNFVFTYLLTYFTYLLCM